MSNCRYCDPQAKEVDGKWFRCDQCAKLWKLITDCVGEIIHDKVLDLLTIMRKYKEAERKYWLEKEHERQCLYSGCTPPKAAKKRDNL